MRKKGNIVFRMVLIFFAMVFLVAAILGAMLPIVPGFVFLFIALLLLYAAFSRRSVKMFNRLEKSNVKGMRWLMKRMRVLEERASS